MIADLCVLGIVVLCIALGYRAGLMRSFVNVASIGVSIILSLLIYPTISSFLRETAVYDMFVNFINDKCLDNVTGIWSTGAWSIFADMADKGQNVIADSIAMALINIVSFVCVTILCRLGLFILTRVLDLFAKLPVIRTFNRFGGSVLGGVVGIAVVYLILALAVVVLPVDTSGAVAKELQNSKVASQMYNNNILISIIKGE